MTWLELFGGIVACPSSAFLSPLITTCLAWLRFLNLRKAHVAALAANPKAKPRHEKVSIELFTKKTEKDFVEAKKE